MSPIDTGALHQAAMAHEVRTAVAAKALNLAKSQGQAVLSMLDEATKLQQQITAASPNPAVGRTLDVRG